MTQLETTFLFPQPISSLPARELRALFVVEKYADMMAVRELVESGKLTPAMDRTFNLEAAPQTVRYLAEGHVPGKVVITV